MAAVWAHQNRNTQYFDRIVLVIADPSFIL